ncbi:MAG: hypothetical protein H6672_01675 [Anaerolineaceae bacterium]|nr:hypothetical protein [Anaerolineaceae bacterium]
MAETIRDFAPYFRNGLLFLPPRTVDMLVTVGLDDAVGRAALNGLALDDQKPEITQINRAMEYLLSEMEEDTQAFEALSSSDTQFMLTGKPGAGV